MKAKTMLGLFLALFLGYFSATTAFADDGNPPVPNVVPLTITVTPKGQTVKKPYYHAAWKVSFQGQPGQSFCVRADWGDAFPGWVSCGYVSGQQINVFHDFNYPGSPLGKYYQTWTAWGVGGTSYAYTNVTKK